MRKIISILLLAAIFLTTLSGCHGSVKRNEFILPEEFDTSRTYEITFWAKNESNTAQANVYKQAVKEFEAKDGIKPKIRTRAKMLSKLTL